MIPDGSAQVTFWIKCKSALQDLLNLIPAQRLAIDESLRKITAHRNESQNTRGNKSH